MGNINFTLAISKDDKDKLFELKDSLNHIARKRNRHKLAVSDIVAYAVEQLYSNAEAVKEAHGLTDAELLEALAVKIHDYVYPPEETPEFYDEL